MDEPGPSSQASPFTRSSTLPLEKELCFFCQEEADEQLFKVCTQNAGELSSQISCRYVSKPIISNET